MPDPDRPQTQQELVDIPQDEPDQATTAAPEAASSTLEEVPAEAPPIAKLDDLLHTYGPQRALGPLSLTLERGCIGLLGPNGAGKSTLLRIMMGLLHPTQGSVEVLGRTVTPEDRHLRRRIGYVPEGGASFPGLTGVQAVEFAGRLVGMDRASALQRAHQVLDYVGLGEARYRDADTFSTGMRQKLKIAQALVHDPELLILDEPTEGVDPEAREEILNVISELVREHDIQLIISTHLLHDVERIATHAVILNQGRVVEHGPVDQLTTAGDRGYQVRVNGAADPLVERLHEQGIEAEWMGNALRVNLQDPAVLLAHVKAVGLVVRHIAPVELSLDEVFEEAVRRPVEDPSADDTSAASPNEEEPPVSKEES